MKKAITSILFCLTITLSFGQEKGDHYLGLNFSSQKSSVEFNGNENGSVRNSSAGISYSTFIKENRRLNIGLGYSEMENKNNSQTYKTSGYNVSLGYGFLFPLIKKFYAELIPSVQYANQKNNSDTNDDSKYRLNQYNGILAGGLLWVPLKHFGVSITLASVGFGYYHAKTTFPANQQNIVQVQNQTSFGLTNQGTLQNQSFTVFYKF